VVAIDDGLERLEVFGVASRRDAPTALARPRSSSQSARAPEAEMSTERWSIDVYKEYLKFSAAHFLIFPDGSAERLHGHNYRVQVEIEARLSRYGLVLDFKEVKPVIRELLEELDEHWILPGQHPVLRIEPRGDGVTEVRYRERYYAAPSADVLVLPINNSSSENLAGWIGSELKRRLGVRFADVHVRRLRVAVEETPGQSGVYSYADLGDDSAQESP
jgi:6-pyruvoyltetrahydropterin/6-carboxytetrahydropterin synthase